MCFLPSKPVAPYFFSPPPFWPALLLAFWLRSFGPPPIDCDARPRLGRSRLEQPGCDPRCPGDNGRRCASAAARSLQRSGGCACGEAFEPKRKSGATGSRTAAEDKVYSNQRKTVFKQDLAQNLWRKSGPKGSQKKRI